MCARRARLNMQVRAPDPSMRVEALPEARLNVVTNSTEFLIRHAIPADLARYSDQYHNSQDAAAPRLADYVSKSNFTKCRAFPP
jgi:hypothetical protein